MANYVANVAHTSQINPPGASPVLTQAQVWAGLERKIRKPQDFVAAIRTCEVVEDEPVAESTGRRVVRNVEFAPGLPQNPGRPLREVCTEFPPSRATFVLENGSSVENIVSTGADGELLLTYAFEWRYPGVDPNSDRARELYNTHLAGSKTAVEGSIKTIRELVAKGELS